MPQTAFQLMGGLATAERFHAVHKRVNEKRGPQFWGIRGIKRDENATTRRPDDLEHRIIDMKYLLRVVPDLIDESAEQVEALKTWAYRPPTELTAHAKKAMNRKVKNPESPKQKIGREVVDPDNPRRKKIEQITYAEAHDEPAIRHPALQHLLEQGDPVVEIVRSLEGWRTTHAEEYPLTDSQKELGWQAFEIFLFSAGAEKFTRALGYAAVEHFQKPNDI